MIIIEPVKERPAFFNGWETDKAFFDLICSQCKQPARICFKEMLDAAWGWKERMELTERQAVADAFGIDLGNKSIGNGMTAIVTKTCDGCGATHHAFMCFHEYRHSCYDISLRAIGKGNTEQGGGEVRS
jgi:hypothetical protein